MMEQDKIIAKIVNKMQNGMDGRKDEQQHTIQIVQEIGKSFIKAIENIKQPDVNITVPEVKIPEINIPIPQVTVQERELDIVTVKNFDVFTDKVITLLAKDKVQKVDLSDITRVISKDNPLPVVLTYEGKLYEAIGSIINGGMSRVAIKNNSETTINPATEEKQDTSNTHLTDIVANTTVGTADAGNSSTTPLGIGGVFTGTAVDTTDYVTVNVIVKSDVASATNGFSLQFSPDGTNWDIVEEHTIVGGEGLAHLSRAKAKWFRVVYTNGGTAQTYFRLYTLLKNTAVSQTFERLSMNIDDSHDAAVVRAVLSAKKPNGDYVNIQATTAGNLKASVEETEPLSDTPEFFEDTSFVTGDSPVTLDLNTALGRNATKGYIVNDGVGNFTVAFSTNGSTFGDAITIKKNEVLNFENISVDSLKITWVADSSYRVSVI